MSARVPEVALVRSVLVAVTGVAAFALGKSVDTSWIDTACQVYAVLTPVVAGWVIRPAVKPVVAKALPFRSSSTVGKHRQDGSEDDA